MYTVFIVDDHPVIRLAVRMLLENQNYKIVGESDNGVDAMQMIRETLPDLVILDISIPGWTAWRCFRAFRPWPYPPRCLFSLRNHRHCSPYAACTREPPGMCASKKI